MEMNDRVKELRKALGLTMEKFGGNLGVGRTAIANIESGLRNLTDQMINSICKTNWNGRYVSETWLRTGEGEMFVEREDDALSALKEEFNLTPRELILVEKFVKLTSSEKDVVLKYVEKVAEEFEAGKKDAPDLEEPEPETLKPVTLAAEEIYREGLHSATNTDSTASSTTSGTERKSEIV